MKQKYVGLFYFTLGLVAMGTSAYADPDPHNVLVSKSYLTSVMPAAQVQTDWNATTGMGAILNKPSLATVATSGSYNDLTDKPTIPTLPTGTEGNVVTYNSNGTIGGSVPTYAGATTQNPYNAANDADKIATMGAVMTAISDKQDAITTGLVEFDDYGTTVTVPALVVTNAAGTALNGNTVGFLNLNTYNSLDSGFDELPDNLVPSVGAVHSQLDNLMTQINHRQIVIPKSGYYSWTDSTTNTPYNTNAANVNNSWLSANVAGTGLVTRTANNGIVGERKIFEATDVSGYSALTGNNKLIADISIPTVGAMMTAMQPIILASGWEDSEYNTIPGVVISTDVNGETEQRMLLDSRITRIETPSINSLVDGSPSDIVDDIHSNTVTDADVLDSIPTTDMTVAIANAAASNVAAVPWNTAEQNATGAYNTTFANSGTNVWPSVDANKVVKGQTFANAMATKQNKISGYNSSTQNQSVLTDTTTDGVVGKMQIMTAELNAGDPISEWADVDNMIPTMGAVYDVAQAKVPKSGYSAIGGISSHAYNTNASSDSKSWLNANVAGSGLITKTSTDGKIGERKIFDVVDLNGDQAEHIDAYSDLTGNNKLIADISIPTVGAMMAALGDKQDAIPARATKIKASDQTYSPSVVTNGTTAGDVGQMAILTGARMTAENLWWDEYSATDTIIPTLGAVGREVDNLVGMLEQKQFEIPKSGYKSWTSSTTNIPYNTNAASDTNSWLNAYVAGTGLVTRTAASGQVGERKVFEATDVSGYHAGTLTQNEKDIQDISIPTVGAMMSVLANGTSKISWGATETTAVQNYSTVFDGTTNNWPAADASLFVDGTALATGLSLKQNIIPAYASGGSKSLLTDGATDGTVGKVAIATAMGASNATNNAKIPTVGLLRDQLAAKQANLNLTGITTQSGMETELPKMSLNNVALDRDALYLVPAAADAQDNTAVKWMNDGGRIVLTQDAVTVAMGKLYDDVKIPATRSDSYADGRDTVPSLVGTTDTAGTIGQHLLASDWAAPLTSANNAPDVREFIGGLTASDFAAASRLSSANDVKWAIPSLQLLSGMYGVLNYDISTRQNKIPKAGYAATGGALSSAYNTNAASDRNSWLSSQVKGSSLVSRTSTDGAIGERKIFEATDVSGYSALTGNNKLIADISIPTVGAMMTVISNNSSALIPAGTNGDLVTYTGTAGTVGSTTPASAPSYNQQTGALENGTAIATIAAVDTMQKKAVCTQWSDADVQAGTQTRCWAYTFTDINVTVAANND